MQNSRFLVEYEIEAHGIFDEVDILNFKHPRSDVEIVLIEKLIDLNKEDILLSAYVIFNSESMETANDSGDAIISEFIDVLTFVTSMNFRIVKRLRVIDWTPGVKERDYWQITQFPGDERPYKVLTKDVIDTVQVFLLKELPPPIRKSIKWFSTGISSKLMDEKFQCFWFVVEILAQLVKPTDKVHDKCPICHEPLYCNTCNDHPKHRPYPKQAISYLFSKVISGDNGEAFRICDKARNCLLHGDEIETVEQELGRDFSEIVDIVGRAAWYAIWNMMKRLLEGTGPHENLRLFQTSTFPEIVGYSYAQMKYTSPNPDSPRIGEWPEPEISIKRGSVNRKHNKGLHKDCRKRRGNL